MNATKLEIEKIYSKIDKIAKKGNDNYLEYYSYIDTLVNNNKYFYLLETLNIKYEIDLLDINLSEVKSKSWKKVLFNTNSNFQDSKMNLMKKKNIYQNGIFYYKEIPRTKATINDVNGSGAELLPNIVNGNILSIDVIKNGYNYSASASVSIVGGIGTTSAIPILRQGKIYAVNVIESGSNHNQDVKLGKISEQIFYEKDLKIVNNNLYQNKIGNKKALLLVEKIGDLQGVTFSNWNLDYDYDKNIITLYNSAFDYLLS
jgi:hypothetical protein